MDRVLEEKDAADWVYRGEGAANIVVAYTGSSPAFVSNPSLQNQNHRLNVGAVPPCQLGITAGKHRA